MKVTIRIADELATQTNLMARWLGISQNELHKRALEHYLKTKARQEITTRLNEVHAHEPGDDEKEARAFVRRAAALMLRNVEWDKSA